MRAITQWTPFPGTVGVKRFIWATMVCPDCGKEFSIGTQVHAVNEFGVVSPSMICPFAPCAFHDFIRLRGWSPPRDTEQA